jgi:hypothetical protein
MIGCDADLTEAIAMQRRTTLLFTLTAIATSAGALVPSAATAQSDDPFAGHIVRVVYRWDNNSSWGFMVYTDNNGQRCFRFGNPGFRPKISDITGVDHKVCFKPGQTSLERSPVTTSVTGVAGQKGQTTIESYYGGTVQQTGSTLDTTFQPCTRLRGEPEFRCVEPTRYTVRLQGGSCEVDVKDNRGNWKLVSKTCEYYPAM